MTTLNEQLARLAEAVATFTHTHRRKPVLLVDADGVIYDKWDAVFRDTYHATFPSAQRLPEQFDSFDLTAGLDEQSAAAVIRTLDLIDYSELEANPAAVHLLPLLLEAGIDVAIATAHTTGNTYCASGKVFSFHRDFGGLLDDRLVITKDKTRVHGDWLLDDKPDITGHTDTPPSWKQIFFTQRYNADRPGPRATWDDLAGVLADLMSPGTLPAITHNPDASWSEAVQSTHIPGGIAA